MTSDRAFDLIVLGGGPAGTSGGARLRLFGHRVALVLRELIVRPVGELLSQVFDTAEAAC
jgi:2-polyprenyl-6-methoxyphenol hydroxylase-like FAD-dependent oxidoreductase